MKRVSGTEKAAVGVPVIVEPIEVEVPPVAIPVKIRDVPVTVAVLPDRSYKIPSMPPPLECSRGCIVFGT